MASDASTDGDLGYWSTRWAEQRIGWHQNQVDKYLIKYYSQITGKALPSGPLSPESKEFVENSKKTWFVPLCGKTLDLPFLLSLGYSVFGVEGVRQAIDALDKENNLGLVLDEKNSTFVGVGGRLRIYFGDLFQCPLNELGPFDFVWDRGSLIAILYEFREGYKKMLQKALKMEDGRYYDFVYLLEVVQYDKTKFGGPPRSADEKDIEGLYGDWAVVKFLEKVPIPADHPVAKQPDIGPVDEVIYLITPAAK